MAMIVRARQPCPGKHEEYPREPGKQAHGLQIFVNLAASQKRAAPSVKHAGAPDANRSAFTVGSSLARA
jgi:redox-sensitive bicupin YhaK (pirin superfamily)